MARPHRVSGLDASFLSLETPTQPLQVFAVLELDTATMPDGYRFEGLRAALAARIAAVPALREKLSRRRLDLDHPVWVRDDDFDITRHVHRVALRPPGGADQFAELCGDLAATPLDRGRPLWEMWVIEGLAGEPGRVAVLLKVHHAAADGVTYAGLLSQLCGDEPAPPPHPPVPAAEPTGALRESVDGLLRFLRRPLYLAARVLPATVAAVLDAARRAGRGRAMAAPFSAPPTPLNARFSAQRTVAFARLPLGDVKAVKDHFGVKVNDVVMTLVGGVVRSLLEARGALPDRSLVALEPVSVHGLSDRTARNQVSGMLVSLQTQIADPVQRLRAVATANSVAKEQVSAIAATLLQDWGEVIGGILLGIAKRVYARLTEFRPMYNVILSNVPGPDPGRYFLGAKVTAMYPFGPVLHGGGVNFTLWSVNGTLHIGLISCPAVLPELAEAAEGLSTGLAELLAHTGRTPTASAAG